jgi:thioredoxin 1
MRIMKPAFLFLLAVSTAAGIVACSSAGLHSSESGAGGDKIASAAGAGEVGTLTEQSFDESVLKSSQPVLVDFFATWCGPCKRMAPIVDEFARKHKAEFRVFECDIDQNRELANRFGVDAVPTFMVFKNGKMVGRFMGSDTAETFESNIVGSLDTRLGSHQESE